MTVRFSLNLELNINDLSIEGIKSDHQHLCDKDRREHHDSDSVDKITGSAALTGGMDLSFDMSEEELKSCYSMIENLGRTFASKGQKVVEAAEKFTEKVNNCCKDEQPAEIEIESNLIAKGRGFQKLLDQYNAEPSKACFRKANDFGRKLELEIEKYLNEVDSPLVEVEELYEELCTKRRELRKNEAGRSAAC